MSGENGSAVLRRSGRAGTGAVVALALLAGCGGDGDLAPREPALIALDAAPDTLLFPSVQATHTLIVMATTAGGAMRDVTADARTAYSSRDLRIAGAGGGLISAAGEGSTTIVVAAEQLVDSVVVRVDPTAPVAIASFSVSPSSVTLFIDNTASLAARVVWANGATLAATGSPFTYRSSDETVARVSASGAVTALREGGCVITVALKENSVQVPVTVAPRTPIAFDARVLPILQLRCAGAACHTGDTLLVAQRGLRLNSYENLMRGSLNGAVVVPGDAAASRLVAALRGTLASTLPMPLGSLLDEASIRTIEGWIEQGACRTEGECPPQKGDR